jgi:hypothetical protein
MALSTTERILLKLHQLNAGDRHRVLNFMLDRLTPAQRVEVERFVDAVDGQKRGKRLQRSGRFE